MPYQINDQDHEEYNFTEYDDNEAHDGTLQLSALDQPIDTGNPVEDVMALMGPGVPDRLVDEDRQLMEFGLVWASCYAQDELVGLGI